MNFSRIIAGTMKWGAWGYRFSKTEYDQLIHTCLEKGITTFDHADIYGDYTTEEEFGAVLKEQPGLRSQLQLITKCGIQKVAAARPHHKIKSYNTSYEYILASVNNSLQNLGTDYLDALLLHRPDFLLHAEEVARAFTLLKEQGKVLHFGVSNFKPSQLELLNTYFPVEMNQVQCSVLHMDALANGTLDQCQQLKILPMAWSPLGGGNLFAQTDDERLLRITAVAKILAEKYTVGPDMILLNWLLLHPAHMHPVLGTTKPHRLQAAVATLRFQLSREEWYMIWRASTGKEVA